MVISLKKKILNAISIGKLKSVKLITHVFAFSNKNALDDTLKFQTKYSFSIFE